MSNDENRLDRKRSFGTVYNDPNIGFAQDGKHFCHDGTVYTPADKAEIAKIEAPRVEPDKRETLSRPQGAR